MRGMGVERYESLYGAADGAWALLDGPVWVVGPPHIGKLTHLGTVSDVVTHLRTLLSEQQRPKDQRGRRRGPATQNLIAEFVGVTQQTVSRAARGYTVRWADANYTALVRLYFCPQPLLERHAEVARSQGE